MTEDIQPRDTSPYPALVELRTLVVSGDWRDLPGIPGVVALFRHYPDGSVDTLVMTDETTRWRSERTRRVIRSGIVRAAWPRSSRWCASCRHRAPRVLPG